MLRSSLDDGTISQKNQRYCKNVISYFFQTSLFLLRLPLHFGLLLQREGRNPIKLDVKTFPFISRGTLVGHKDAMVRKGKLLSFVPNQRLPYKLVDLSPQ